MEACKCHYDPRGGLAGWSWSMGNLDMGQLCLVFSPTSSCLFTPSPHPRHHSGTTVTWSHSTSDYWLRGSSLPSESSLSSASPIAADVAGFSEGALGEDTQRPAADCRLQLSVGSTQSTNREFMLHTQANPTGEDLARSPNALWRRTVLC